MNEPYGLIQNYRADNSSLGRSVKIDGLAAGLKKNSNSLLVIECKYRKKSMSLETFRHLEESVSIFPHYKSIEYYLFSRSGFSKDLLALKQKNIHLVGLDDLFAK